MRLVSSTTAAAARHQKRPQNVEGEFFVDHRCIDCDTCRWMAPETFTRVDGMSAVTRQPSCEEERVKALQGSVCLYHKPLEVLFTGDHLASSEQSLLEIVSLQSRSVRKLLDIGFVWILPGHEQRIAFRDNQETIVVQNHFECLMQEGKRAENISLSGELCHSCSVVELTGLMVVGILWVSPVVGTESISQSSPSFCHQEFLKLLLVN